MTRKPDIADVIALRSGIAAPFDAEIASLLRYWDSMRKSGDVPRRSEIDPRRIEPLLEQALIAERIAPGLARLRIAGSHLSDLMGMEVRGMPLSALLVPEARPALADLLTDLFERPACIDLGLEATGAHGASAIKGRLVLLPLRSDLGDISRALGCLLTRGPIGAGPHRFSIATRGISPLNLPSDAGLAPCPPVEAPARQTTPRQSGRHPAERPWLRLVK